MIKTQTKAESKFLRRILPHYYKVSCFSNEFFHILYSLLWKTQTPL